MRNLALVWVLAVALVVGCDSSKKTEPAVQYVRTWDCGAGASDNVMCALDNNRTVWIFGTGAMGDRNSSRLSDIGITGVVIKDGVTSIGRNALSSCYGLTSVTLPNSVIEIGDGAFGFNPDLTSVMIGSGVATIGDEAFIGCSSLMSIDVASNNANYSSEDGVLFNKDKTFLIRCPATKQGIYTIPDGTKYISWSAFSGCKDLTTITIPNSVETIDGFTFLGCDSLMSVICLNPIPPTIRMFPGDRFRGLTADYLYVPKSSIAAYRAADGWKDFKYIKAIESAL